MKYKTRDNSTHFYFDHFYMNQVYTVQICIHMYMCKYVNKYMHTFLRRRLLKMTLLKGP